MDATPPTGLLLLDVDGVFNPCPKRAQRPPGYETARIRTPNYRNGRHDLTVWFNPAHGAAVLDLSRRTGLQPVWCSQGWTPEDANTMFGPWLGLPELPAIRFDETFAFDRWKFPRVTDFLDAAGRPRFAWLDDDFATAASTAKPTYDAFTADHGDRCLLVDVDPHHGLQDHHLDLVEQWAAQ